MLFIVLPSGMPLSKNNEYKCYPNSEGIMIPGSAQGSDLSTHICGIKRKLKDVLLEVQKIDSAQKLGWKESNSWYPENFLKL